MGNLDQLRAAVSRRLESLPALAGIPVVPEDRQNIKSEIDTALGKAGGLVITVSMGNARGVAPADPLPQAEVEVVVECAEIPAINRGPAGRQMPAVTASVQAVCALHHWPWEHGNVLTFGETQYDRDDKTSLVIYTCIFNTRVTFAAQLGLGE